MSGTDSRGSSQQHGGGRAEDEPFDGARFIVRARRMADLSQRELAEAIGLSRATVGRLESGAARVDTMTLSVILEQAGLRLAVVDGDGQEVTPIPSDVLRDHGGRRFPGHLDARPPLEAPADRVDSRRGGPPARGWYHQRPARAYRRGRQGVPLDHPTESGLRDSKQLARERVLAAARARHQVALDPECACLDACFERACLAVCPCQCEPDRRFGHRSPQLPEPE